MEKEKGAIFSYRILCECVCVNLNSLCIRLPLQTPQLSSLSSNMSSETGRREEFMLPVPALSVKLIRLRAPENSIISDSFNNRTPPPPTAKPPVTQNYHTLLYFSIHPPDMTTQSQLAQCLEGRVAGVASEMTECRVVMVVVLFFS